MAKSKEIVVVGMSGGVDSSVSALLLKEQGYDVIGLFMKNWEEKDEHGNCRAAKDFEDVARVCDKIQIPYYSVNFVKEYSDHVFAHFLAELKLGHTPNPDILCNREIKFQAFLTKAKSLGARYLATGHYCQIQRKDDTLQLVKGQDPNKDQSYFLYTLPSQTLNDVLFPVGHLPKAQVRKIAKDFTLPTAEKKDSTGICFIGERNFKNFISNYIPYEEGPLVTVDGKKVGPHEGKAYYTVGQRKGLGLGGPGEPWFVVGKEASTNTVIIAQGHDHHSLYAGALTADTLHFTSGRLPPLPFRCKAKIRYRQEDQDCTIEKIDGDVIHVRFDKPQRAITPRQSIVFYDDNICLGGAMIIQADTKKQ
jgi:tRNA-specific 2-thiouridylase